MFWYFVVLFGLLAWLIWYAGKIKSELEVQTELIKAMLAVKSDPELPANPLRTKLKAAIQSYDYPTVTFDFGGQREVQHKTMREVESCISDGLLSGDPLRVKDALSNVLYWGLARVGYRDNRVEIFRQEVGPGQLAQAATLFRKLDGPGLRAIAALNLPQFSKMAFVSKVRMFLDPLHSVVLDSKIASLKDQQTTKTFEKLKRQGKYIPITNQNEKVYEDWCKACLNISSAYFPDEAFRAVDIERGIFRLIESGQAATAAEIVSAGEREARE